MNASVFPPVFVWICVWVVKKKASSDLSIFSFLSQDVRHIFSIIFDHIDTSTLKHAERTASSNTVNLPIKITSSLTQTLPYAPL